MDEDTHYLRTRHDQEVARARATECTTARRAHEELAALYAAKLAAAERLVVQVID